jgi:hypothetical protein
MFGIAQLVGGSGIRVKYKPLILFDFVSTVERLTLLR